jgi:hypothetical protein
MSVANSGVFKVVDAIQVELAELALSIPAAVSLDAINASIAMLNTEVAALNDATKILYNWQFTAGFSDLNGAPKPSPFVPAGPLPAGVYAVSGFVTISDSTFTSLAVALTTADETPLSTFTTCRFTQSAVGASLYTMPISFYFKVDQDLPSVVLEIGSTNQSLYGNVKVSVQLYEVNQAWPTPLAPSA